MMNNAISVSNYFIKKANDEGVELTPLKLLKLVYLAHCWHLGNYNKPLIREKVRAWKYGPVITEVYYAFRMYGRSHITSHKNGSKDDVNRIEVARFLDYVWDHYKNKGALYLSAISHTSGSPWHITYRDTGEDSVITNDAIFDYYSQRVTELREKQSVKMENANKCTKLSPPYVAAWKKEYETAYLANFGKLQVETPIKQDS